MTPLSHFLGTNALSSEELAAFTKAFVREEVKKGAYLVREGEYVQKISLIESGLFKLYYLREGQERIMMFFQEGQFVTDYFGYLTQPQSIRPIQALEDAVLYSIRKEELDTLFEKSKASEKLGRVMAENAYLQAVQRANRLIHDDPDTLFSILMEEHPDLFQRVPHYMIASYLNMTPETLSRVKKRLLKDIVERKSVHDRIDQ